MRRGGQDDEGGKACSGDTDAGWEGTGKGDEEEGTETGAGPVGGSERDGPAASAGDEDGAVEGVRGAATNGARGADVALLRRWTSSSSTRFISRISSTRAMCLRAIARNRRVSFPWRAVLPKEGAKLTRRKHVYPEENGASGGGCAAEGDGDAVAVAVAAASVGCAPCERWDHRVVTRLPSASGGRLVM